MTQEKAKATAKRKSKAKKPAARNSRGKTNDAPTPNGVDKTAKAGGSAPPAAAASAIEDSAEKRLVEDFDALSEYLVDVSGKSQEVIREFFVHNAKAMPAPGKQMAADPLNLNEAFQEMMQGLAFDPGTVMQRQFNLWGDFARLMATTSRRMSGEKVRPAIEPAASDKRFNHPAWNENQLLDFVKQSYLTYANWLQTTVSQIDGMNEHERKRAEFYTQQFLDAIAPTNFPMLNPEVIEATVESRGENLLKGLKNLLEDIDRGEGALSIRQADLEHFKIGENIATTPGKVVYQNEVIQLIQYEPTSDKVARRPLLICPPWINKFYILDLQPKNSFIKWMVDQGRTVFVVSWVNPDTELKDKTFLDYIRDGLFAALDAIEQATGEAEVDAIGYCIGGTMLATGLCLMAENGDKRIKSCDLLHGPDRLQGSGRSAALRR